LTIVDLNEKKGVGETLCTAEIEDVEIMIIKHSQKEAFKE
jgi:hypothetical protein